MPKFSELFFNFLCCCLFVVIGIALVGAILFAIASTLVALVVIATVGLVAAVLYGLYWLVCGHP